MTVRKAYPALLDEMSIVDIFTQLIFDAEGELQGSELLVIELLGRLDDSLLGCSRRDISEYLSAMGVNEMIQLVNQLKQLMDQSRGLVAVNSNRECSIIHH